MVLIETLLAIEDRNFYNNDGINISSIMSSILVSIVAKKYKKVVL
ncbi:transglycosylase domain-containing protein [Buchnera aphidicola]|uniref:Glycosyl transferase family 51 domain-containing protein n=1 Tax=Buchnera aphidicola (Aphis gossypii) TaxID=98785 RepID=A0A5J6ZDK6_9GAMM|nr:hypothetical protein FQV32_01235 [Buchnera aphidicola (Aphis gossypii)]